MDYRAAFTAPGASRGLLTLALILASATAYGQTTVIPSVPAQVELGYFRSLFMRLAEPGSSQADLQRRQALFATQFQLTDADSALLASATAQFGALLAQIGSSAAGLMTHGQGVTDSDRQMFASLISQRDQAVVALVAKLKTGLQSATALRIWETLLAADSTAH